MALSSDNVKIVRQYAGKIEKWAENLSYSTSPAENLWSELTLSLYPQDLQGIASWLANLSTAGHDIQQEFEELSKLVQEIDAWRNQGVYPEDLGDFCARINGLMKVTRNIISVLRTLSDPEKSESHSESGVPSPHSAEQITRGRMGNSPAHAASEMGTQPHGQENLHTLQAADKALPKEALMAYKLRYEDRLNIQQIAKKMTTELNLDKSLRPWQISRWIKQVENLYKRTRIPIRSIAPKRTGIAKRTTRIDSAAKNDTKKT
jgi:hypothetical protein